jgi:hypothetical protein
MPRPIERANLEAGFVGWVQDSDRQIRRRSRFRWDRIDGRHLQQKKEKTRSEGSCGTDPSQTDGRPETD